ncbi:hypothetical protein CTAYLR_009093 [Chrysophaeum taylorii]|uniref:SURF1-like protein n=1 Tax=Chrysophaeum taylorii TaxID=2483200 RepID=A0AAD7UJM0_9STRA|nr:hypothetical protein CTAYLR_009093 [Chrysophaeum taylorii]
MLLKAALSRREALGAGMFGSLVCGTFGLGVWQARRYEWKKRLIEERRESLLAAPVPLTAATAAPFRRVTVVGEFKTDREVRVGPRSAPGSGVQGLATSPMGYDHVTACRLEDGREVLVNRGWAPNRVETTPPKGRVSLVALVDPGEPKRRFSPQNTRDHILWLERDFLARVLSCEEILLVQISPSNDHFPRPRTLAHFQQFPVDPATHLAYAATWFAISFAGAIMTRRLLRVRKK